MKEIIKFKSIGADPEFFIKNVKKDIFLPSTFFVNGTKEAPEDMGNGFSLLKDNLSIEGNIPAAFSKTEFIKNIKFLKKLITLTVKQNDSDAEIFYTDEAKFKTSFLMSEDGVAFGCSSYEDAWNNEKVQTPVLINLLTRQIGFHIHIGYEIIDEKYSKHDCNVAITKAFDTFLSNQSDSIHFSKVRRKYYGRFGSFRNKPYGVECRSLGGYFTQDKYLSWIYDQVTNVIDFVNENIEEILKAETIQQINEINTNKKIKIPE